MSLPSVDVARAAFNALVMQLDIDAVPASVVSTLQSIQIWFNSGPPTPKLMLDLRAFPDQLASVLSDVFTSAGYATQARAGRSYNGAPLFIADLIVAAQPSDLPPLPVAPQKIEHDVREVQIGSLIAGPGITLAQGARAVTISADGSGAASVRLDSSGGTSLVGEGAGPNLSIRGLAAGFGMSMSSSSAALTLTSTPTMWFVSHVAAGDGGASILGEQTRTLNVITSVGPLAANVSLAANVLTLQPGTYIVRGSAPAFAVGGHQASLCASPGFAKALIGTTEYATVGALANRSGTRSHFTGQIVVSGAPASYVVRHYTSLALASVGLGSQLAAPGAAEIYTTLEIMQLA